MAGKDLEFIVPAGPDGIPNSAPEFTPPSKKKIMIAVAGVLVVGLGVAAWQFWPKIFGAQKKESKPEIVLDNNVAPKSVSQDTDHDGLNGDEEKQFKTDPQNPDTDGDELSDGDEIHIYSSNPNLRDTDGDGFEDGKEVAGGYSPVNSSTERADPKEVQKWTSSITRFSLHEPTETTITFLDQNNEPQASEGAVYDNQQDNFQVTIPSFFSTREQNDGQDVGIYETGAETDEEVDTDPMFFKTAVKIAGQNLEDWIDSLYHHNGYSNLREIQVGSLKAVQITIIEENCSKKLTFFENGTNVIIFTLNCSASPELEKYYNDILASFKFL